MRKLSHEEITARQIACARVPRVPLVIVLDNIRSLLNVGSIFRTADGAGVEKIMLCGITGYPPQSGIARIALGAEESVPWEYHKEAPVVVKGLRDQGYEIVALEQAEGAVPCDAYFPQRPTVLLIGNEVEGVSLELMALSDIAIEIPMVGVKNSLNVSVAFGVAVFIIAPRLRNIR